MSLPPMARVASRSLGQDVIDWCIARRLEHPKPTFQDLADELNEAHGTAIHPESLRRWYATQSRIVDTQPKATA